MRAHIELQDDLLNEVIALGKFKTKKKAVNSALLEYAKMLKRKELLTLQGRINWLGDLDRLRTNRS